MRGRHTGVDLNSAQKVDKPAGVLHGIGLGSFLELAWAV